jgi:predicted CXXCH cytochrome family protein
VTRGEPALRRTGADLCVDCHSAGAWVGRAHTHPPLQTGKQCLNCHGPHGGVAPPSLKVPGDQLCFTCHSRKLIEGTVVHPALRKGCVVCHDPHGSDGPALLRQGSIENMCRKCHADLSKHFHRPTSPKLDPRGQPLTCTSCHSPHAAAFPNLLLQEPKHQLCARCHGETLSPADTSATGSGRP